MVTGGTIDGATDWQQAAPWLLMLHVDTSAAHFKSTPTYFPSLAGESWCFYATGGSAVYNASPTGFDVYVSWPDKSNLTAATANSYGWHINWTALGN